MTYVAIGELVVIAFLVWIYRKARDHEVQAVLDLMADQTVERAELLNAARSAGYVLKTKDAGPTPEQIAAAREAEERRQEWEDNLSRIGRVE